MKNEMKIGCFITSYSSETIERNIKYLKDLKHLEFTSRDKNKIDNQFGNSGCDAIFKNTKYLTNLEALSLGSNMRKIK